jgi:hypothetical protein
MKNRSLGTAGNQNQQRDKTSTTKKKNHAACRFYRTTTFQMHQLFHLRLAASFSETAWLFCGSVFFGQLPLFG